MGHVRCPNICRRVFMTVLNIYIIGTVLAVPYFNWQYASQNGFMEWLVFGEVVATLKAPIWPYFVFRMGTPTLQ